MDERKFLGLGWAFPPSTVEATGSVAMCEGEEDIAQAIRIILLTRRGERAMRPDFGSLLHTYAFEDGSQASLNAMAEEIKNSLVRWEPRIENVEVSPGEPAGGCASFTISYTVRSTNSPFNLVFPFYLEEGGA